MTNWLLFESNINIQISNEIFEDFSSADFKTWKHKAFAYTYYYLITYIHRNVLYGLAHPEDYNQDIIIGSIASARTAFSYITKKNGLLEKLDYIKTTNNYPTSYYMDNGILQFTHINDIKSLMKNLLPETSPNFTTKSPTKAFKRYSDDEDDFTGTYYDFQNTHSIPIKRFIEIMTNDSLRYTGLYIYGYLIMMCDRHKDGYKVFNQELANLMGCNKRTITKYMKELEHRGFIESEIVKVKGDITCKLYKIVK